MSCRACDTDNDSSSPRVRSVGSEVGISLVVLAGGYSGHCTWLQAVSINMAAFNTVDVFDLAEDGQGSGRLVAVGAGCTTGQSPVRPLNGT